MAPEYVPYIVIFDAKLVNGALKGSVQYVEPDVQHDGSGNTLRVRWNVESQPQDFMPVGEGVAFVDTKDTEVRLMPISEDASPDVLGNSRYRWREGLQLGVPKLMFILILPQGYTLTNPNPSPTGVKSFQERLALYWILRGDAEESTEAIWTIEELDGNLGSEIVGINNAYVAGEPSEPIEIPLV